MIGTFLGITAICLFFVLICGAILNNCHLPDVIEGALVIVFIISLVTTMIINPLVLKVHHDNYMKFKTEYELKTQLYNSATNKSDTIVILDISEINADLIEMQSEKKAWGRFCYYPDNILDYKLIGVEEKS